MSLRSVIVNALGVVLFFALGLAIAEWILRVSDISYPYFSKLDQQLGWSLQPNTQGLYRREGKGDVHINNYGIRGRDIVIDDKDDKIHRIALLGDSFIEGLGVRSDEVVSHRLQYYLDACQFNNNNSTEVLNFGVSGYGTIQQWIQFQHRVLPLNVDTVILAFNPLNDVQDNFKSLTPHHLRPFINQIEPFSVDYGFQHSDFFKSRQQWHWQFYYWLLRQSSLVQLVRESVAILKVGQSVNAANEKLFHAFRPDRFDRDWHNAWQHTELALLKIAETAKERQIRFILIGLGVGIQITPDQIFIKTKKTEFALDDFYYPNQRLASFSQDNQIEYQSIAQSMQQDAIKLSRRLNYINEPTKIWGHWNAMGHDIAAKNIAAYLCERQGPSLMESR